MLFINHYIMEQQIYKDFQYTICFIDSGWFTAYIDVSNTPLKYLDYNSIDLNVWHGLTFGDHRYPWDEHMDSNKWIIGWDYAHFDDAIESEMVKTIFGKEPSYFPSFRTNHHTIPEIRQECKNAIEQIIEMVGKSNG